MFDEVVVFPQRIFIKVILNYKNIAFWWISSGFFKANLHKRSANLYKKQHVFTDIFHYNNSLQNYGGWAFGLLYWILA